MFNSDMKSFSDNSISDLFVNNDTNGSWVNVEDCSGSSVIVFIWHTFVDGTIADYINDISNLISGKILGNMN
jgi:hypothetical protein